MVASIASGSAPQWIFSIVVVAGVSAVAVQQLREPEATPPVEVVVAPLEDVVPILPALPVEIDVAPLGDVVPILPKIIEPPVAEVVRIDGEVATIAGTGQAGEEIIIMSGTQELARTTVGTDGTYAVVFDYIVPDAGAKLDVVETNGEGENIAAENSIAILPRVGADPTLAQLEGDIIKVEVDNRDELTFAGIVYGDADDPVISGNSTPNTTLSVSLNGKPVGSTEVNSDGIWSMSLANLDVGQHILGFTSDDGQSFEVPIERAAIEVVQKITRGDTLWRIAELRYGDGRRYTDIYNMNADKISNPDLIFPDQDLVLPTE